jgi:hypothetical protein
MRDVDARSILLRQRMTHRIDSNQLCPMPDIELAVAQVVRFFIASCSRPWISGERSPVACDINPAAQE